MELWWCSLWYGISGTAAGRILAGRFPLGLDSAPSSTASSSSPAGRWCHRGGSADGTSAEACSRRGREPDELSAGRQSGDVTSRKAACVSGKTFTRMLWLILPPQQPQTDGTTICQHVRGRCKGGLRGGTPESSFCKGWDMGCIRACTGGGAMGEGLWGRSLSPRRCCGFCSSPPIGWGSRRTRPRCSTAHLPPAPGSAPPCRHSCNIRSERGVEGGNVLFLIVLLVSLGVSHCANCVRAVQWAKMQRTIRNSPKI